MAGWRSATSGVREDSMRPAQREAARQRLNAAGLVELPFSLLFHFSTGIILLLTRSDSHSIVRSAVERLSLSVTLRDST